MKIDEFLKQVVERLKVQEIRFALAGGVVASIYRAEKRLTMDLDFLILAKSNTFKTAMQIIKDFSLKPVVIRKADLEGGPLFAIKRKSTVPCIISGSTKGDSSKIGLDFILPEMPWFKNAMNRAKHNNIDFGFGPIPCLTVEDIVISKLLSYKNKTTRFKDLDDLQSIFMSNHEIDLSYLYGQMQRLTLNVPDQIKDIVPKALKTIFF